MSGQLIIMELLKGIDMQYILTEEEYNALAVKKAWKTGLNVTEKKLQELCTKIANEMPVKWGWPSVSEPAPWGCILTEEQEWYCDKCPVQAICPCSDKEWSQ